MSTLTQLSDAELDAVTGGFKVVVAHSNIVVVTQEIAQVMGNSTKGGGSAQDASQSVSISL